MLPKIYRKRAICEVHGTTLSRQCQEKSTAKPTQFNPLPTADKNFSAMQQNGACYEGRLHQIY